MRHSVDINEKKQTTKALQEFTEILNPLFIYEKLKPIMQGKSKLKTFDSPKNLTHVIYGLLTGKITDFILLDTSKIYVKTPDGEMSLTEFKRTRISNNNTFRTVIHMLFGPISFSILLSERFEDFEIVEMGYGILEFKVHGNVYRLDFFDTSYFHRILKQIKQDELKNED